ncbi:capsular polysaccharide transport system permease protein [Rhizobium azibense]|nr:capsular polysaccharide transport system permease protein [Rhizobium azibense]
MGLLLTHARVVTSLVIREMNTRYGNKIGGYLWAIADPLAYIAFLTLIRGSLSATPPLGRSVPLFISTGYLGFLFYVNLSSYISSAVKSNRALLSYPRVSPFDAVVSRLVLQFSTTAVVTALTLFILATELGGFPSVDWPIIIEAAFATSMIAAGIGLLNAGLFVRWPWYEKVFGILNRPLFFLSGVFMLPDELSHPFSDYFLLNPLVHCVIWFRTGFYPEYRAYGLDKAFVLETAFVLVFLGILLFTLNSKIIKNEI